MTAAAQQAPLLEAELALLHRSLAERSESGTRLLNERGALPRLQLRAGAPLGAGSAAAEFSVAAARLTYDGRTQAGMPLVTTSAHRDVGLNLLWRPWAPAVTGEWWAALRWHGNRRAILATHLSAGLTEASVWISPGIRWRSPAWSSGGVQAQIEAQVWASAKHRLRVNYHGLFDDSTLAGGRRSELVLRASIWPQGSPWRFSAEWARIRQAPSHPAGLLRNGTAAGSVRQPRMVIDDTALSITRVF